MARILSANKYALQAWATKPGAAWPCSVLARCESLYVKIDDRGDLVDLEHPGVEDIPADELNAWIEDQTAPE